jgi:hypothetical protein
MVTKHRKSVRRPVGAALAVLVMAVGLSACHFDEAHPPPTPWHNPHSTGHNSALSAMHVVNGPEDTIPGCSTQWQPTGGAFPGYLIVHGSCSMTRTWIKGGLDYYGGGTLTLNDSIVAGGGAWMGIYMRAGGTLNLTDTTVQWKGDKPNPFPTGVGAISGGAVANMTIRRSHISGNADGIQAAGTILIEDSWINNLASAEGTHNDGIQLFHGSLLIRRSVIDITPNHEVRSNGAVFTQEGGGNTITTVRAEDSLLRGGGYVWRPEDCTSSQLHNTVLEDWMFAPELSRPAADCPATVYS